ncbi:hypothetical protein EVJ58_g10906 [Rhodofomes roseus]|uniref:Uncharacterized protein n=1 Tax=Rhodofomes roseus TaxID=34475 RepID=A0A4Y9XKK3_9APHY|nr:hypothetical protein EVJ58_g10906 [Rhodofomes roseus]
MLINLKYMVYLLMIDMGFMLLLFNIFQLLIFMLLLLLLLLFIQQLIMNSNLMLRLGMSLKSLKLSLSL